jgi:hypothetical protein
MKVMLVLYEGITSGEWDTVDRGYDREGWNDREGWKTTILLPYIHTQMSSSLPEIG